MRFEDNETPAPIIIKRVKKVVHGHHGGAWKVAFADFAVAMMAFFLVLWLLEATSVEEKQAISGYFNDPTGFTEGGSPYVIQLDGSLKDTPEASELQKNDTEGLGIKNSEMTEDTVQTLAQQIEKNKLEALRDRLQTSINDNPKLKAYKDQIIMEVTDDGLQIQIVDKQSRPMFDSGSNKIKTHTQTILKALARSIKVMPNKISISGHTDAAAFTDRDDYSNWELSAERANTARRALLAGGIHGNKIAQVSGLASSTLFDKNNPLNPINRRISILVLNEKSAQRLQRQQEGGDAPKTFKKPLPEDPEFDAPIENKKSDIQSTLNNDIERSATLSFDDFTKKATEESETPATKKETMRTKSREPESFNSIRETVQSRQLKQHDTSSSSEFF